MKNEFSDTSFDLAKALHHVAIAKQYFDVIKEGMHDVTVIGTAAFIKVPGHELCAKTGTAQNPHANHGKPSA